MCVRPRNAKSSIALCDRMLRSLSSLFAPKRQSQQVGSLSSLFSALLTNRRFSASSSLPQPSSTTTHFDSQSLRFSGIAQSVISRCSDSLLDKESDKGKDFASVVSYKDILLEISDIVPEFTRRFRRVCELRPQDALEILVGFELECGKVGFGARKVESLWELFKWANGQHEGFKHLLSSWEVMARILVRAGLFREVELLVFEMDSEGILLGCNEIFSDLIEGYIDGGDLNRAISMYDRMRRRGLAPSLSCFHALLCRLVRMRKTQVAYRVCMDMVELGIDSSETAKMVLDGVVRLLCEDGKVQEARNLVKKVMAFGFDVRSLDVNGIVYGYCEKRDFDDVLSLFREIKCAPNILAGNRVINSLCSYFGSESAQLFMEELEGLGFVPDEITFGILIGWCCREGKLRSSFAYLAEIFSRELKPHINSYNALACGLFLKGTWKHARDIFNEMVEKGRAPNLSTFRILLAGYCKARQFDEVKRIVHEMENHGLMQSNSLEGQLSRAFSVLGFDPFTVRLKRDNDADFSRSDFFDDLGNGLYLDTDLNEYERRLTGILEDGLVPDYNALVMKECNDGNLKAALTLAEETVHWGQELSLSVFSVLLKGLCVSSHPLKVYENVLEKNLKLLNLLDQGTLNLIVQVYCKRGWTYKGKIILDDMFRRHLKIGNVTYTAMITGLCKTGNLRDFHSLWDIARKDRWLPRLENCQALLQCLCKREMLKEALELLEKMLVSFPHLRLDICYLFLEKISLTNSTRVVHILLEELIQRECVMDQVAYGHVMRGMCYTREFSEALKILENSLAGNLTPSFDVAISLIPQLCKANRHKEAIALKEISLTENPFSILPMGNALIKGFCMTGKVREATSVLQEMPLDGTLPDAETYDILVQGFGKVNNLKKVGELLGVMIRKNFELSLPTYRNLVLLMCLEGKVPRALKLKEFMLGQGKSHDLIIFNILIFQLFSTGNCLSVNEVLDDLRKKKLQLDEVSYNFLVYGFSKCKDVSSTFDYLSTMIAMEFRPSNRSLRTAVIALCNSKELEKALALSREMERRGWFHDSIVQNAIVESLLSRGEVEEAENFLQRLVEKQLIPGNINYDNLIKHFCSFGRTKKAVDLLNIMLKKGIVPNSTSYESVISSYCASNNLSDAMNFHTEMLDRNLRPSISTWKILVHLLSQEGQTTEAERILVSMVGIGETPTKEMFSYVIDRYRFESNPKKASELVEMMQRSGFEPDFETHWSVISNLKNSFHKSDNGNSQGFLSRLLSDSGFFRRNNSKAK